LKNNYKVYALPFTFKFWAKVMYFFTRSKYIKMMLKEPNITAKELNSIIIPVHVLAGEKDIVKYEHSKYIADNIKNSTLEIIENENHGSYIAHSDKIYNVIKKYL
jgi:pimeloyl-ACP methyl ester carboxylesterase